MTTQNIALKTSIKAVVKRVDSISCGLQVVTVWVPVAPTVKQLPPAPSPVVNIQIRPPESVIAPPDFDPGSPNICQIFDEILVVTNDAVYAEELDVEELILPYNEIVNYVGLLRTYVNMFRYNYTLKPRQGTASPTVKVQSTGVRLYKFKCETGAFGFSGVDAKIFPERKLVSGPGIFIVEGSAAAITPIRIFGDKGSFVTSFADAAVSVPGTFSLGWTSTTNSGNGGRSPIGISYRKNIHLTIYSASVLLANGARANCRFKNLRWYVTDTVPSANSILGFNVRLYHTTSTTTSSAPAVKAGESKITVYADSETTEFIKAETLGVLQLDFSQYFTWDGVSNLVVETCTTQCQTNYTSRGALRTFTSSGVNVRRHDWSDNAGSMCSSVTTTPITDYISTQMDFE